MRTRRLEGRLQEGLLFLVLSVFVVCAYADTNPLKPQCPDVIEEDKVPKVVHPCNCNSYYVCLTDPPIPMSCPSGLQFDQTRQICDYKWKVKCRPHPSCPAHYASPNDVEQL
ncbi:hypothetical protein ANTRET_LOCUS7749 [Anthophora retusa]